MMKNNMLVPRIRLPQVAFIVSSLSVVMLAGCAGSPSALAPASPNATMISNLFTFLFVIAVIVFVVVEFLLFYSVIRFRRKRADEIPEQIHGNTKFEIAWTVAPALVLAVVFGLTWQTLSALSATPPNSLNIKVTGSQWWWQIEYPAQGVVTANEIHVPVGQAVNFTLEATDVIHSFWVPELNGKTDLIPGKTNHMWIRPDKVGTYRGQCAEFCGTSHANMRFYMVVETADQFNAWVAQQKQNAVAPTGDLAQKGLQTFMTAGCIACHTVNGTSAQGKVGPNLTHVASRQTIAAGMLPFTEVKTWISDPPGVKPGSKMPKLPLTPDQIDAIVAYLQTLK